MADPLRVRGGGPALDRYQTLVSNAFSKGNPPWMRGRLLENVRCEPNVETTVLHRLGRKPRGFMIVGARTDGLNIGTAAADLVSTELTTGEAKLRLVTSGSSPRIYALWFW